MRGGAVHEQANTPRTEMVRMASSSYPVRFPRSVCLVRPFGRMCFQMPQGDFST